MAQLQVRSVVKSLDDGRRQFRLEIPHFDLGIGDLKVIVGKTGAGKTTALDILALASSPNSAGSFSLTDRDGHTWHDLGQAKAATLARLRARNFGYVLQSNPLFPFLSLYENAVLGQRIAGRLDPDYLALLFEVLQLDLPPTTRISQMSVGQRQRLSVVRALAHRPPLILCDEPTAALDDNTAITLLELLAALAKDRLAGVLVVTHDAELVARFGFQRHVVTAGAEPGQASILRPAGKMV